MNVFTVNTILGRNNNSYKVVALSNDKYIIIYDFDSESDMIRVYILAIHN